MLVFCDPVHMQYCIVAKCMHTPQAPPSFCSTSFFSQSVAKHYKTWKEPRDEAIILDYAILCT